MQRPSDILVLKIILGLVSFFFNHFNFSKLKPVIFILIFVIKNITDQPWSQTENLVVVVFDLRKPAVVLGGLFMVCEHWAAG